MASTHKAFFFFFFIVISVGLQMVAGRNIPTKDKPLQPEWLGNDRSVLIPGMGRVMVPKKGDNLFNYNPVTGAPGGSGGSIPGVGGSTGGASGGSYVPGGDDTLLPGPGVGAGMPAPPGP